MPYIVLQKTQDYIIVNKPAGMVTHPNPKDKTDTLADILVEKFPELQEVGDDPIMRPGIVHRLDKAVSGVLIAARTQQFFEYIKKQFQKREVLKTYIGLVHGAVSKDEGEIKTQIGRSQKGYMVARTTQPRDEKRESKIARTAYSVIQRFTHYTLLEIKPLTGRTHQIRVHLHSIGHPIVGDTLYTSKHVSIHEKNMRNKFPILTHRIWLHAQSITFTDLEGEKQTFTVPPPDDIMEIIKYLQKSQISNYK